MVEAGLKHTPYDGSSTPFTIGMRPIAQRDWICPDDDLVRFLDEKERLLAERYPDVFQARADTLDSQQEIADALIAHVCEHAAPFYAREPQGVRLKQSGRIVVPEPAAPLLQVGRLVQDDLVIMRKCADGWRLAAAHLSFPSSWPLREKFDRPMSAIHADVPDFAGQMEQRIARIFDNMQALQPVERFNWSLYDDPQLHHPDPRRGPKAWAEPGGSFSRNGFLRVERQTLMKMPRSGDILFTIRVYHDPVRLFADHVDGARLAGRLRQQLLGMSEAQLDYKGLLRDRDMIADALAEIAAAAVS
ncbi:heme-dependent oxidative N-demethylase family protein [Methylovirgula sp. 4M-Z18]|uniref:heme-dependent oxidative N-demethylase family protein n=1 Tax=Methylovirgula sp. 4M-Z18 TaxID=2293567 RepID=UPI000E2F70E6|nr:DUF3445 domain-containing protein [Methylovirgula sp. 4M-Z18]RFB78292.1 DUF3445 domain-containing protein [Methylovirgula sp. 4M-Z18]